MAPTNGPLLSKNTVLYRCYIFLYHLRHPQGALHQELKLNEVYNRLI